MANINVTELFVGTLEEGFQTDLFVAFPADKYSSHSKRARFFSVSPDPGRVIIDDTHIDMEITRSWNTVWENLDPKFNPILVFQVNNTVSCSTGGGIFHLLMGETDN